MPTVTLPTTETFQITATDSDHLQQILDHIEQNGVEANFDGPASVDGLVVTLSRTRDHEGSYT